MRSVLAVVVAIAALTPAGPAFAQGPQARIDAALARAQESGIPVALLENKIAEGKAKGVPIARIAAAVERRAASLERARLVLQGGGPSTPGELTVAADAVESGVSDAVLRSLAASAPGDRRAVAIVALTQLVQLGHVPERALAQVQEALKGRPEALLNLPAVAGRRGGGPPVQLPEAAGGAGRGAGGPPSGVPAGGAAQPGRPGGPPPGAGPPEGAGPPQGAGPPDGAGPPGGNGPPAGAGPPPGAGRGRGQ